MVSYIKCTNICLQKLKSSYRKWSKPWVSDSCWNWWILLVGSFKLVLEHLHYGLRSPIPFSPKPTLEWKFMLHLEIWKSWWKNKAQDLPSGSIKSFRVKLPDSASTWLHQKLINGHLSPRHRISGWILRVVSVGVLRRGVSLRVRVLRRGLIPSHRNTRPLSYVAWLAMRIILLKFHVRPVNKKTSQHAVTVSGN